jgi:hypothetical protein
MDAPAGTTPVREARAVRRPARRRAVWVSLAVALALAAGLVTSCLIAWQGTSSMAAKPVAGPTQKFTDPSGERWSVSVSWMGRLRSVAQVSYAKGSAPDPLHSDAAVAARRALPYAVWRRHLDDLRDHPAAKGGFWNMQAYGWPCRCLTTGFLNPGGGGIRWGAIEDPRLEQVHLPATLAYQPIWGGLAANTALFAVPWAALLWGLARAARWWRRRGPGTCAACGYDLRGNRSGLCPECGAPRPVRA